MIDVLFDRVLAAAVRLGEPWATVFDKTRLLRREVPLGFDVQHYTDADYDAVIEYLAPFEAAAAAAPLTGSGLRWCYYGKAVLFEFGRILNVDYDDLVKHVDIGSAIRLMNDYLGGCTVVVSRDREGRVVRQAERDLYLPQPNWLALSGAAFIDVCKLEVIHYGEQRRRIAWRTVHSPNGSAALDDGSVTFASVDPGRVKVTIRGIQRFTLPPFWAGVEPWLLPSVKDAMVQETYRRFFTTTLDNIEACYEGREYRIGHDADTSRPSGPHRMQDGFRRRTLDILNRCEGRAPAEGAPDANGFQHFCARTPPSGQVP